MEKEHCDFIIIINEKKQIRCSIRTKNHFYAIKLDKEKNKDKNNYDLIVGIDSTTGELFPCSELETTINFADDLLSTSNTFGNK